MSERFRVLVVDDDDDIRRISRLRLRDRYDVLEADSGPAAIEVVKREPVDLVVLDVMMPGMTGLEACQKLKAAVPNQFLPVLLLTALDDQTNRNKGLEAGADDYLSKPIDAVELQLRVKHFVKLRTQDQLIRKQVAELERLSALRDDLTSMLVHDLRNPLVGVLGSLELMRMAQLSPEDRSMVDLGYLSARRVMELTDDLLRMRMLEDGGLVAKPEPMAVDEVVAAAVTSVAPAAEQSNVKLNVMGEAGLSALLDRKLVQRSLENLLVNAIRHTRGIVDVEVAARESTVSIAIADRGAGVPDALKPGLFEKYGSVELKRAQARRGHGLGLYMVGLVTKAHGGTVEVLDREGGGAVFRLVFRAS